MEYDGVILKPDLDDALEHYGVLGMKWGVRRYQDKNGNLTEKGKKKYASMNPERLRKKLQRQVRKAKKKKNGWSNQWMANEPIGKESEKALEKRSKDLEKYQNSKEYKDYMKKLNDINNKIDKINIYDEKWQKEWDKIEKTNPNKEDRFGQVTRYGKNGKEESTKYSKGYGKKITEGYLKDLGYSKQDSEYLAELLNKKNKNLH